MITLDERKAAWQELFFDGKGNLTAPGKVVFEDLRQITRFGMRQLPEDKEMRADPLKLAVLFAMHTIFLTIQERLNDG